MILLPPATIKYIGRKFSPIFTSNIMWQLTYWYPGGRYSMLPSQSSKSILTFPIFCNIASYNSVLPFDLSSAISSLTELGILAPYLWLRLQYFDFTFEMIILFFSSHVGPTMQMQVPERFGFDENIHIATVGIIPLHLSWSPMLLIHLSTQ